MGITFTPFVLIMTVAFIVVAYVAYILAKKGWYKTSGAIVLTVLLISWTEPYKLTTETRSYTNHSNQQIMERHVRSIEALPPRVVVERKSYDDYLDEQSEKLTKRVEK